MERVHVGVEPSYSIDIEPGLLDRVGTYVGTPDAVVVITDENVYNHYGRELMGRLDAKTVQCHVLAPGEGSKSLPIVSTVVEKLLRWGCTRKSLIVAFGGGVVGDLAGFSASVYMRGVPFIQIPTSLLAQVDSSVGGKTGVNTPRAKNVIGSFYQPQQVVIDPRLLATLPRRELISGMAEVIKYGIIYDRDFFLLLENEYSAVVALDPALLTTVIHRCCQIKADVVTADEKEMGLRRVLNFGHTLGHALEAVNEYATFTHGEAVFWGMEYEAKLAVELGLLDENEAKRIRHLIHSIFSPMDAVNQSESHLLAAMKSDKKNRGSKISFILPTSVGEVKEVLLSENELRPLLREILCK